MNNNEKYDKYRMLKSKLKIALKNSFWLEACMIEYAIIEDRTSSILVHAGISTAKSCENKKLQNKLNSILYQIGKNHYIISKKVSEKTISEIVKWKEDRNDLVHRSCTVYNEELAKNVAEEGKELVDAIINDSAKVSRYAKKLQEKENKQ